MPIYEFKCPKCRRVIEKMYAVKDCPEKVKCSCGKMAKKILSRGGIICDSVNDVKWLPSACKVMQKNGEPPIQSRTEYNKYLKTNHLTCKG